MNFFGKATAGFQSLMTSTHSKTLPYIHEGITYYDAEEAFLHSKSHEDGGLTCKDPELLERQRKAIYEITRSLGRSLFTGNFDLLKVSLPVKIFEPRSYLQKLADPWIYTQYLTLAAQARDDPVLRMQYCITFILAGFHRVFMKWAKPFNPILGETWQASLPDGTRIYIEQASHHPPVSVFEMIGQGYKFHGHSQPKVTYKLNAVKTSATGYRRIEFADGGFIDMVFPQYYLKGLLNAAAPRAEVGGVTEFFDMQNGLVAVIRFGAIDNAVPGGLLSRPDALSGTIYSTKVHMHRSDSSHNSNGDTLHHSKSATAIDNINNNNNSSAAMNSSASTIPKVFDHRHSSSTNAFPISRDSNGIQHPGNDVRIPIEYCRGTWLSHIDWGETRFWTLDEEGDVDWIPDEDPLPSDCRFREDLQALARGDEEGAQRAKELLEKEQRADAKLRKKV